MEIKKKYFPRRGIENEIRNQKSIKIAILGGLIGGAIIAAATRSETTFQQPKVAFVEQIEPPNLDSSLRDEDSPFSASIIADAAGRFNLNIENMREFAVTMRFGLEVIDDRGKSMRRAVISNNISAAKRSKQSVQLDVWQGLPDGYYIIRTKIAFVGPDNIVNNTIAEAYLEVINSQQNVITYHEFNAGSLINVAIIVEEKSK